MDDLFTTRQVQNILKVDRITIYRMLQDGRLKGIKVGPQWRFTHQEVDRLVSREEPPFESQAAANPTFPTHCVQAVQDLFAAVSQIGALVVDTNGAPLTEPSRHCGFCQLMLQNPSGLNACRATWQAIARQSMAGSKFFTCHAGVQYMAAPIIDGGKIIGSFLMGEFHWQNPDPREETSRMQRLADTCAIPLERLQQEGRTIPVIDPSMHTRVEGWPFTAARAVISILEERTVFIQRLQQIADLTQFS